MNSRRCLQIAERMNLLLKRDLGEGVDGLRLMHDALYARDVLLVCESHRHGDLPGLARQWREALAEVEPLPQPGGTRLASRVFGHSRFGSDQPGFFHSQAGGLNSGADSTGFGLDSTMTPMPAHRPPAWYSPARWFGSR
ncbi:MAG: hypothetical protein ACOVOT_00860 [Rubrivivax sp.]|jgi:hypothetical protein|nr:hypothetical protein [Rubrivivax sp.]